MPSIRFDFPPHSRAGPALYTDPVDTIRADRLDTVLHALEAVQSATVQGLHAAGFISYEAAPAFDPAMQVQRQGTLPLLWFGLFEGPAAPEDDPAAHAGPDAAVGQWEPDLSRDSHAAAVKAIRDAIAEGRTYQVNLTTRFQAAFDGDPVALYHRLRRAQGGGYHALVDLGRHVILSASPELFFQTRGRTITTRPMKGTRRRGRWPDEDRGLREALLASPKDRAENLMITDLLRNDLGRVCVPGGVQVPALWDIEPYRTVWQLTSTVTGRLRDDVGLVDLFAALFPCGSVTGAPKISTMGLIADLERSPREVYCGAIGWVRPGGDCTFNVPIRTAWIDRDARRIRYGAGGGVVWDSTPEAEYDELLDKTIVVRDPWPEFHLLETLALQDGAPVRLHRHLRRMAASADRFGYPFPEREIETAVEREAKRHTAGRHRLRVTVDSTGHVETSVAPLHRVGTAAPGPAMELEGHGAVGERVVLAAEPVDSRNLFLYHKTTHRAVYQRARRAAPDAFDVLLWNERDELTEFCTGNLVVERDGRLLTPPLHAGLLAGCLRGQALDEGTITEASISRHDLPHVDALWFINSARGWIPVRLD